MFLRYVPKRPTAAAASLAAQRKHDATPNGGISLLNRSFSGGLNIETRGACRGRPGPAPYLRRTVGVVCNAFERAPLVSSHTRVSERPEKVKVGSCHLIGSGLRELLYSATHNCRI
jgi:hypothetical protein